MLTFARARLTPPRPHGRILHRQRLTQRLLEALDYRLTIVQAGPGYGKTTALASLVQHHSPLVWYHLSGEDADPSILLFHLVHGFRLALPSLSETPLALLEGWEGQVGRAMWTMVVDALLDELVQQESGPLLLVLDNAHLLETATEDLLILDRFIGRAPFNLHVILSTRYPPKLPTLSTWRVRGELLEIRQEELVFTPEEVAALFRDRYRVSLTIEEIERLTAETEGWAIALQLVWQGLRGSAASTLPLMADRLAGPAESFFAYMAREVLDQQPPDIREFLLATAVLSEMTASICDRLRRAGDSDQILRYLIENGLFVVSLGEGHVRYHHLFRDFLCRQLPPPALREAHRRAALACQECGERERAIEHFLEAESFEEAADILDRIGYDIILAGRLDTLGRWIHALPPTVLERHPTLLVCLGDIARLRSRFDEALRWYRQVEEYSRLRGDARGLGQALRGQARVYLDTVNPHQAEHLLQEALRIADGQEDRETRARLMDLLAENLLNLGRLPEAEQYRVRAQELREEGPGEAELAVRVLLRTGRLERARELLEERMAIEQREPVLRPRAHRETPLLLSLILALQGEGEAAYRWAVEGTRRGQSLGSPFVVAVGQMRQGHARLVQGDAHSSDDARRCFQQAIAMSDTLAVPRLKVEAYWGLCMADGLDGEIEEAEQAAWRGIEIAGRAGDEWIAALIRVSLGAGYTRLGRLADAADQLGRAWTAFRECSDTFGETVARLWQCLLWQRTGDDARLERGIENLLRLAREHGYDFLFRRRSLLGMPDPRLAVPLLLLARDRGWQRPYAEGLLAQMGLTGLEVHPGYQLRVQSLGRFRAWRGDQEIAPQEWRREKARQLFQLLLTYRHAPLHRDQLIEMLWPGMDTETGQRNLKVALSALCRALEPQRGQRAESAYVFRNGSLYSLRAGADLWVDADAFESLIQEGDRLFAADAGTALDRYRSALALYQGDYLMECPYEEWCSEKRERLLALYLRTADRLAGALAEREQWEETIQVCRSILAHDDCWERAYALTMVALAHLGNRAQALRTYQRCAERLRQELEIEPSAEMTQLYQAILQSTLP